MIQPWILVLADDLTGALEAGAKFAERGFRTRVTVERRLDERPPVEVLVIDTETRHVPAEEAYRIVGEIAEAAKRFRPQLVYQKTDSTLRGNIAAELRAIQSAFAGSRVVYVPAYPEMGRTVKDGLLYVQGRLLHETEFAKDPLNPRVESDVNALLGNESVRVLDGTSSQDVEEAARMVMDSHPMALAAGPAALAGALADVLHAGVAPVRALPVICRCLVVNGSMHPCSREQVTLGHGSGCFDAVWTCFEDYPEGGGSERARAVGERVRAVLGSGRFDGLVVFGGDTAHGIHAALGGKEFEPWREIVPGVPLSRCGDLFWITKAGGFGLPNLLSELKGLVA